MAISVIGPRKEHGEKSSGEYSYEISNRNLPNFANC